MLDTVPVAIALILSWSLNIYSAFQLYNTRIHQNPNPKIIWGNLQVLAKFFLRTEISILQVPFLPAALMSCHGQATVVGVVLKFVCGSSQYEFVDQHMVLPTCCVCSSVWFSHAH